jgi:hypothetical protein
MAGPARDERIPVRQRPNPIALLLFWQAPEQVGTRLNHCAGGTLWRGQEKGAARIGEYGQAFRRTHDAKDPGPSGCVAAGARCVAALDRIADTPFASIRCRYGHCRITSPQRNAVDSIWSQLALRTAAPFGAFHDGPFPQCGCDKKPADAWLPMNHPVEPAG